MRTVLLCTACLLVPSVSFADAFQVRVLQTNYTTTVSTQAFLQADGIQSPFVTRTTTSDAPITDSLDFMGDQWARAAADLFKVSTQTDTLSLLGPSTDGHATATAVSVLRFQPTTDGTAQITLDFVAAGEAHFSSGNVDLLDLTTGATLWTYGWDSLLFLNAAVPWAVTHTNPQYAAQLAPVTELFADHQYALTLQLASNANEDQQDITITASGLEPTPEPASLMLIATGITGAGVRRWRRQRLL